MILEPNTTIILAEYIPWFATKKHKRHKSRPPLPVKVDESPENNFLCHLSTGGRYVLPAVAAGWPTLLLTKMGAAKVRGRTAKRWVFSPSWI
jgi:hypothetical protein